MVRLHGQKTSSYVAKCTTVAASESLGRLVKTQTGPSWRISDAAGLGWCLRIYILVSSQEMLLLVAQGPHFENQCIQLTHFLG